MLIKNLSILLLSSTVSMGAVAANNDVLFSYEGKDYQLKDIQPYLQQSYFDAEIKARESLNKVLEQAMVEMYIENKATKADRPVADVQNELFAYEPVTTEEVKKLYDQLKDHIGLPLEQVEPQIRQELENRKRSITIQKLIATVKKETRFQSKLPKPEAPSVSMDLSPYPWKGDKNAEITVVEFADYNCGYCRTSKSEIDKLMKQYKDKVKLHYVDFLVTEKGVPGVSTATARGAYCAGKQDKFWEFYDLAYEKPITLATAGDVAENLDLNQEKFTLCVTSDESRQFVLDSNKLAMDLGVSGTPTFFVNGQRIHTHDPAVDLRAEIEKHLSDK
ncbi:hypothetical protein ACH42_02495 [Endozoicomonas sp. (ex Bugula neritina AB1)]|nr:hypothetical protein ACH42_02495 [Endozoicomonas sp. (ex Bugula neritina AB1)]